MEDDLTIPAVPPNQIAESDDSTTLKRYINDKFLVTHQVRLLEHFFLGRQSKERTAQCHELMVKLAEDRFTLAVVGQFKRGKSSLMNALVGRELLPTGVLPLTSAITILRFGPREQLVVTWEHSDFERDEPLSALNDYVTEEGNPGNKKQVRAVYVEVPSPFLRRGLEFVDTPGVGSAIEANTATTYAFIPKCDAVVFVTGVDAPMTGAELSFLRRLRRDVGKVFCVVNKIDLLPESERAGVIGFVTDQVRGCLASSDVRVFPVSSRLALREGYGEKSACGGCSGIPEFRHALGEFLSTERTSLLLRAIIERSLRLLAAEEAEISVAERAARMSGEARQSQVAQIRSQFDAIRRSISQRSESLAMELRAAVVDAGMVDLDERLRLGVVGLADGLMSSITTGQWESARSFIPVVARNIRDEAKLELNEWLAGRRYITGSKLPGVAEALRNSDDAFEGCRDRCRAAGFLHGSFGRIGNYSD